MTNHKKRLLKNLLGVGLSDSELESLQRKLKSRTEHVDEPEYDPLPNPVPCKNNCGHDSMRAYTVCWNCWHLARLVAAMPSQVVDEIIKETRSTAPKVEDYQI